MSLESFVSHGVFWSSWGKRNRPGGRPVLDFEPLRDPSRHGGSAETQVTGAQLDYGAV